MARRLRCLANPLFWAPFIVIILVKLSVFHLAVINYYEYQTVHHNWSLFYFNMDFEIAEPYADFSAYYMSFVERFSQGYLPYTPDLYMYGDHQVYIYPPLFLYIITAFYRIPFPELLFPDLRLISGDLGFARVGFSFVFCDIVTCVIIFAAAKKLTSNRSLPAIAMLLFGLNPIALWWGDYMWMSTPIHTCFLTLGFYFLLDARLRWAAFWITVAVMVKQTAGILLPVILVMELARDWKRVPISLGIMAAVAVTLSMPYLVLYPWDYLTAVMSGMGSYPMETLPPPTYPVPISVLAWYLPEPLKSFIISITYLGIPFVVSLTTLSVIGWLIQVQPNRLYREQILVLTLLLSLSFHTFFSRGIFKYYLIALLPFLVLLIPALRGPLVRLRPTNLMDFVFSSKLLPPVPKKYQLAIRGFLVSLQSVVNRLATWALLVLSFVSITLFGVHRYVSPAILLSLWLCCLLAAWYHFDWKSRPRPKTEPP
jgi:hypothetical protein